MLRLTGVRAVEFAGAVGMLHSHRGNREHKCVRVAHIAGSEITSAVGMVSIAGVLLR